MLRRRPDNTYEFRMVELVLQAGAPGTLTAERREALRLRIMSRLGAQDHAPLRIAGVTVHERWIAVPAGLGLAATIAAAIVVAQQQSDLTTVPLAARGTGDLLINGRVANQAIAGDLIVARSAAWLSLGPDAHVGMSESTALTFKDGPDGFVVSPTFGEVTLVTNTQPLRLQRDSLVAAMDAGTVARFALIAGGDTLVTVDEGLVVVTVGGSEYTVTAPHSRVFHKDGPPATESDGPSAPATPGAAPEPVPGDVTEALGHSGERHGRSTAEIEATEEKPTPGDEPIASEDHGAASQAPGQLKSESGPASPPASNSANIATPASPPTPPSANEPPVADDAPAPASGAHGADSTTPVQPGTDYGASDAPPHEDTILPGHAREARAPANPQAAASPPAGRGSSGVPAPIVPAPPPAANPPDPVPGAGQGSGQGNAYGAGNGNSAAHGKKPN